MPRAYPHGYPSINDRVIRRFVVERMCELRAEGCSDLRVLDVGCGGTPYRDIVDPVARSYVGMDVTRLEGSVNVVGSAEHLPVRDESCDLIMATEVMEHVPHTTALVEEWARVLAPGGMVLVTWPFVQALHELPRDYGRLTEFGARELFAARGLACRSFARRGNLLLCAWALNTMLIRAVLHRVLLRARRQSVGVLVARVALGSLGLADRVAIRLSALATPEVGTVGGGLGGARGAVAVLPLGYCMLLVKTG